MGIGRGFLHMDGFLLRQGVADLRSSTINIVEEVASTSGINAGLVALFGIWRRKCVFALVVVACLSASWGFCLCASTQTTSTDSDTSSTSSMSDSNSVSSWTRSYAPNRMLCWTRSCFSSLCLEVLSKSRSRIWTSWFCGALQVQSSKLQTLEKNHWIVYMIEVLWVKVRRSNHILSLLKDFFTTWTECYSGQVGDILLHANNFKGFCVPNAPWLLYRWDASEHL